MSLLPLGLLSQGGGAGGAAAFELISTTLISTSTASVTFSSIVGTYTHLQLRANVISAGNSYNLYARFNGVSTSSYRSHSLTGLASGVYSADSGSLGYMNISSISLQLLSATYPTSFIADILDYTNTSKNKTIRTMGGNSDGIFLSSGFLNSTSAITSLTVYPESPTTFAAGTRLSLYGIKGA